jgi:mRNA-degrading endonuclease RelE of RelBE toxin-antitoxin system
MRSPQSTKTHAIAMSLPYDIQYANEARDDIRALRAFDQRKVLEGIETHLTFQPKAVTRSRIKAMLQPFWSQFRLRIENFRVYYDVDDTEMRVYILRILTKSTQTTPEQSP